MSIIRIVWRRLLVRGSFNSGGSKIGVRGLPQIRMFIVRGNLGVLRIGRLIVRGALGLLRIFIPIVKLTRWLLCRLDRCRIRTIITSRVSRRVSRRRLAMWGVIGGRMSRLWSIIC